MLFPHSPQPQGLKALADQFKDGKAVKKMFNAQLVEGANNVLAYFSKHRPYFAIHKVMRRTIPRSWELPDGWLDKFSIRLNDSLDRWRIPKVNL